MRVFVYGTLTDAERVEAVLDGRDEQDGQDEPERRPDRERPSAQYSFAGAAVLEGLHRVDGRYPTLAPGGRVEGRLLAVDDRGLERLDRYEGVETGLYARVSVPEADGDGSVAVYVGDPTRLGVEPRLEWPAGESFDERVRTYVRDADVYVRRTE